MRIPEVIEVVRRQARDPEGVFAQRDHIRRTLDPARTYQEEADRRREQERMDEELARRMQFAMAFGPQGLPVGTGPDYRARRAPQQHERRQSVDVWGIGNAGAHQLNDNFIREATDIVRNATDEILGVLGPGAAFGRRGERESGRRRSQRPSPANRGAAGLAPNAFGDESVLGVGPPPMPTHNRSRRDSQNAGPSAAGRPDRIGDWLSRVE